MYSHEEYLSRIRNLVLSHQSVQSVGFTPESFKPGLDGMEALAFSLGNPQNMYKCIHVAGTNGKGAVCSMIAAALAGKGYKVGLYTSPHLVDFRERIKVVESSGFSLIPEESVWDFLEEADLSDRSFFEITTAMAFWWFARQRVDYAVLEVGLGGLYDSTNIITPEVAVVTSIGLDHCAILGNTRPEIAEQKAGIFKPGVPALVWGHDPETDPVFESVSEKVGARLHYADTRPLDTSVPPDIDGPCKYHNLRLAKAALELLGIEASDSIFSARVLTGFRGRWEHVCTSPDIICDIGHNPPALKLSFEKLNSMGRPLVIVYGVMADKDLDGIAPLMPAVAHYVLVAPDTPRALPVGNLSERLSILRPDLAHTVCDSVADGVSTAMRLAETQTDTLIFIGGSSFVVSEALLYLQNNNCAL